MSALKPWQNCPMFIKGEQIGECGFTRRQVGHNFPSYESCKEGQCLLVMIYWEAR